MKNNTLVTSIILNCDAGLSSNKWGLGSNRIWVSSNVATYPTLAQALGHMVRYVKNMLLSVSWVCKRCGDVRKHVQLCFRTSGTIRYGHSHYSQHWPTVDWWPEKITGLATFMYTKKKRCYMLILCIRFPYVLSYCNSLNNIYAEYFVGVLYKNFIIIQRNFSACDPHHISTHKSGPG